MKILLDTCEFLWLVFCKCQRVKAPSHEHTPAK
jgi:hypothetical protein